MIITQTRRISSFCCVHIFSNKKGGKKALWNSKKGSSNSVLICRRMVCVCIVSGASISCEELCMLVLVLLFVNSLSDPSVFAFQSSKVLFFQAPCCFNIHSSPLSQIFFFSFWDVLELCNNRGSLIYDKNWAFGFQPLESNYRERRSPSVFIC